MGWLINPRWLTDYCVQVHVHGLGGPWQRRNPAEDSGCSIHRSPMGGTGNRHSWPACPVWIAHLLLLFLPPLPKWCYAVLGWLSPWRWGKMPNITYMYKNPYNCFGACFCFLLFWWWWWSVKLKVSGDLSLCLLPFHITRFLPSLSDSPLLLLLSREWI